MSNTYRILLSLLLILIFSSVWGQETEEKIFIRKDTIQSRILNETRVIDVYLPPNYFDANDTYPLQIVLGNSSRASMYYSIANYLSQAYQPEHLNQLHTIPQSIIVGVGHTNRNNIDNFRKFIHSEIIPLIENRYRNCHYKTLIGHSVSGELVLRSLFDAKSPFQSFYCSAPSNSDYFIESLKRKDVVSQLQKSKRRLFFAAGENDYFISENLLLIEELKKLQHSDFAFLSLIKSKATHHSVFPVSIMDALFFTYKDWHFNIPENLSGNATELFLKHYKQLSIKTGFEIKPPEFDFYLLAYLLNIRNKIDEKIKILKTCKEYYPKALNADAYLARTYYSIGDIKNAKIYNEYSLSLNPNNEFAKTTRQLIDDKKN